MKLLSPGEGLARLSELPGRDGEEAIPIRSASFVALPLLLEHLSHHARDARLAPRSLDPCPAGELLFQGDRDVLHGTILVEHDSRVHRDLSLVSSPRLPRVGEVVATVCSNPSAPAGWRPAQREASGSRRTLRLANGDSGRALSAACRPIPFEPHRLSDVHGSCDGRLLQGSITSEGTLGNGDRRQRLAPYLEGWRRRFAAREAAAEERRRSSSVIAGKME